MLNLICCCCGDAAPAKEQWWNRDTGFGLCGHCALWIQRLGTEPNFERTYGVEGVNWMPITTTLYGRRFRATASFRNQDKANEFMAENPGHGFLAEQDGWFLLAGMKDEGEKV